MDTKNEIKRLWSENFNDRPNWIELYFNRVFNPDNALILRRHEEPVSCMQLIPYGFNYQGAVLKASYVAGACTGKKYRKAGNMTKLMGEALEFSYERGDDVMILIPADRPLYFYYDKFDFATVFYIKEERYTSLHTFKMTPGFEIIDDEDTIFNFLQREEAKIEGRVLHTREDFENILWDNESDGGSVIAIGHDGHVEAVAFAVPSEDGAIVKELMFLTAEARETILGKVKELFPDKDIIVEARVIDDERPIESRGMLRILNVYSLLQAIAGKNPSLSQVLKISDTRLAYNNHIYVMDWGDVRIADDWTGKIDTEMDIKTMAEVLFNTHATGNLFGLPSSRPSMSLMLE